MSFLQDFTNKKFKEGVLMLDNGVFYNGFVFSSGDEDCIGEICFNTAMTGYQEIASDPSYSGQIIVFSFPHIGNVGCNDQDVESIKYLLQKQKPKGIVIKNLPTNESNYRSTQSLLDFCEKNNISIFAYCDTRSVIKQITSKTLLKGNAVISAGNYKAGDCKNKLNTLFTNLKQSQDMNGIELACNVYPKQNQFFENHKFADRITKRDWARNLAVIDFGVKENILRLLEQNNFDIKIFPHDIDFKQIEDCDAFFLSNGPGDPRKTYEVCKNLIHSIIKTNKPIFGICLGHQMLSLAFGLEVVKMPQGHRGANQPVKNLQTGLVEITSQNHGFCVSDARISNDIVITHRSLFDGVIEGFENKNGNILAIQYHPESSPGPHDSRYLFKKFRDMVV